MADIKSINVKLNPYLGKCFDCKWWQSFTQEWGNCELTRLNVNGYEHPNSLAIVTGTAGPARLGTSFEFGCIMHEARTDDDENQPVVEVQE